MTRPAEKRERDPALGLLQYLGVEISEGTSSIDDVLESVSVRLLTLLNISRVGASLLLPTGEAVPVRSERSQLSLPKHIDKVFNALGGAERNPSLTSIEADGARLDTLALSLVFRGHGCYILLLQSETHENKSSYLSADEVYEFCSSLKDQLSLLLERRIEASLQRTKSDLLRQMLRDEKLFQDEAWHTITTAIPRFLNDWDPLKLDSHPRVQLFTFDPKGLTLSLRGDTNSETVLPGAVFRVDQTIAGVLITTNLHGQRVNHVALDPTLNANRYRAYLRDPIPLSELLIAIRQGNELSGVISLEHFHKSAFSTLQVSILLDAAAFIAPFIHAVLSEAQRQRKKEVVFLYIQNQILRRLISTYRHKIGQFIPMIGFAIRELERDLRRRSRAGNKHLATINQLVSLLVDSAKDILSEFPSAASFQSLDVVDAAQHAINEYRLSLSDPIDLTVRANPEKQMVFASGMLREHIYNLLQNASHAIALAIREGRITRGRISITIDRAPNESEVAIVPRRVILRITDNGVGVPISIAGRIFEYGVTTKGAGGTGYGLPAARDYARSLGGDLQLENSGGGATFVMILQEYTPEYHDELLERLVR